MVEVQSGNGFRYTPQRLKAIRGSLVKWSNKNILRTSCRFSRCAENMKNKYKKNMRRICTILLVNLILLAATITSAYQDTSPTQIEFRLGQRKAVPGYVEMGFYKSTKTAFVNPDPIMVNHDIESAVVETGGRVFKEPVIRLVLSQEASKKFAYFTEQHINDPLAIMINGKIMIMPVIRERITSGVVVIVGQFTKEEAEKFVNNLN
jgi:hypothetical protein